MTQLKPDRNLIIAIILCLVALAFLAYSAIVHFQNTSAVDSSPFSKAGTKIIYGPQ